MNRHCYLFRPILILLVSLALSGPSQMQSQTRETQAEATSTPKELSAQLLVTKEGGAGEAETIRLYEDDSYEWQYAQDKPVITGRWHVVKRDEVVLEHGKGGENWTANAISKQEVRLKSASGHELTAQVQKQGDASKSIASPSAESDTESAGIREDAAHNRVPNDDNRSVQPAAGPESGATDLAPEHFAPLFLSESDLPNQMKCTQRLKPGEPDKAFVAAGGQFAAMSVWTTEDKSAAIWRLIDIRWVLPDERAAQEYMRASLAEQSEDMPEVRGAINIGEESHLFGPGSRMAQALGGPPMYNCIFREGRVIAKVFVAMGTSAGEKVGPEVTGPLVKAADARMKAFEQTNNRTAQSISPPPGISPSSIASEQSVKPSNGAGHGPRLGVEVAAAPESKGARVVNVIPGSAAAAAKLQRADVIQKIDHNQVTSAQDLQRVVSQLSPNTTVQMHILRGKKTMTVSVELKD